MTNDASKDTNVVSKLLSVTLRVELEEGNVHDIQFPVPQSAILAADVYVELNQDPEWRTATIKFPYDKILFSTAIGKDDSDD